VHSVGENIGGSKPLKGGVLYEKDESSDFS
jgi:hypothetical protein